MEYKSLNDFFSFMEKFLRMGFEVRKTERVLHVHLPRENASKENEGFCVYVERESSI